MLILPQSYFAIIIQGLHTCALSVYIKYRPPSGSIDVCAKELPLARAAMRNTSCVIVMAGVKAVPLSALYAITLPQSLSA